MQQSAADFGTQAQAGEPGLVAGRRATIAMQTYRRPRAKIVARDDALLHPLSESELAAALGVSRPPVREAFGGLEEEGLISIQPQYGTFVTLVRIDRVVGDQCVREALECAAVRIAAERCTPADAPGVLPGRRGRSAPALQAAGAGVMPGRWEAL